MKRKYLLGIFICGLALTACGSSKASNNLSNNQISSGGQIEQNANNNNKSGKEEANSNEQAATDATAQSPALEQNQTAPGTAAVPSREEVIAAYEAEVSHAVTYRIVNSSFTSYEMAYIDPDDIPELICFNGTTMAAYTYYNGEVSCVTGSNYGDSNIVLYREKSGLCNVATTTNGNHWEAFVYNVNRGGSNLISDVVTESVNGTLYYYLDRESVSEDEYNNYPSQYDDMTRGACSSPTIAEAAGAIGY